MAWFRRITKPYNERVRALEAQVELHKDRHAEHETQLAVIHTNQDHMSNRLDEIRETTQDTNKKIDGVAGTLTEFIMTLKSQR